MGNVPVDIRRQCCGSADVFEVGGGENVLIIEGNGRYRF